MGGRGKESAEDDQPCQSKPEEAEGGVENAEEAVGAVHKEEVSDWAKCITSGVNAQEEIALSVKPIQRLAACAAEV
jgi:hypothetical protein